ncbi:hypothetical protein PBY51_011911 [Eleginops maclovinus]|nr:hypothetical protein PBY51_011911 [Eleginops maclovinus]
MEKAAASPRPGSPEIEFEASPVRATRRRPRAHRKSVVSHSEEDNVEVLEPFKGMAGNKNKWIDPKVIKLDDSEPEEDLDYIPPSPIPDDISYHSTSALETRSKSANSVSKDSPLQLKGPLTTLHQPSDTYSKDNTNEQLFSIMQSICSLVDTIPEHELIALSCGCELLLKRAQRKRIILTDGGSLRTQQPDSTVISEPSFKDKLSLSCETSSIMSSSSSVPADPKMLPQLRRSSIISVDYDSDHSDSVINQKALHSKTAGQ